MLFLIVYLLYLFYSAISSTNSRDRESRAASAGPLINPNANGNIETNATVSTARTTGAIPKIKALNLGPKSNSNTSQHNSNTSTTTDKTTAVSTFKNALTKKSSSLSSTNNGPSMAALSTAQKISTSSTTPSTTTATNSTSTMAEQNNSTLNRISKSSLQWLLVNKWIPLWMGQGTDCKVIDFNFMFSRDCVDCDSASAAAQMGNPYGTPRLSGLPQDIVRFNARAEMHASSSAAYRRHNELNNSRPQHNTLNRLREGEPSPYIRRYEDPSYENVHVQWQNGFEFGRSRDYDHSLATATTGSASAYPSLNMTRAPLQRARSESPNLSQRNNVYSSSSARRLRQVNSLTSNQIISNTNNFSSTNTPSNIVKHKDPNYRNIEKTTKDNNIFKANLPKADTLDAIDTANNFSAPKTSNSTSTESSSPLEDLEGAVGGIEYETTNETASAISTVSNPMQHNHDTSILDTTPPSVPTPAVDVLDNDILPISDTKKLTSNEQNNN